MPKTLLRSILLLPLMAGAAVFSAAQPPRHIANVSSRAGSAPVCVDVYEYDCVDIQPQFPGGDGAWCVSSTKNAATPRRPITKA